MVRHLFKKTLNTKAFLSFAAVVCLNILISPELGAVTVTASINSSTDDAEQRVNSGTLVNRNWSAYSSIISILLKAPSFAATATWNSRQMKAIAK
jgi:hypothetical protein